MPRVIGIDLGTTNCCVAVVDGTRSQVLHNKAGYKTTPSVIAVTEDGKRLIGQLAVRQQVTNPEHTVYAAKRLIGRAFDSPQVQHAMKVCPYRIVQGPNNDVRIELRGKIYSIPETSAMLLQEMRALAEEQLGETVEHAVVTVPAYFNDNQRQAVRDAGRIAGLDVLRILNEPTAAAIAYGHTRDTAKTIVVYDMGGGTFDVSIVRVDPGTGYDVIATTGDSYLGGEDFDNRVVEWMIDRLKESSGIDATESPLALARMRQAAQKAKCELSDIAAAEIQLPFLMTGSQGAVHLETTLRRDELEKMTGDLVTRSLAICEKALRLAELRIKDVEEVVLVGGMTRMPAVQRAVFEFFEREPSRGVHPDEVVAVGAAIHGQQLLASQEGQGSSVPLHDVTAHALGIMTAGGNFDPVIPANTTVPVRIGNVFATSRDNQEQVKIVVLQGESTKAAQNEFLGQFALTGLRKAKAGEVEVEVVFEIDDDGIFRVAAIDRETGEAQTIEVLAQSGLDEAEISKMMSDAEQHMADRRELEEQERNRQGIHVLLADLDRLLPQAEQKVASTPVAAAAIVKARKAVDQVRHQVDHGDPKKLGDNLATLQKLSGMLKQVLSR
ncbi:MAG: molecular chaperone DnaK [Deltaproteobacteria bacterium]|nr:molecular chaperone DnaK [Deltaproteobacteria bacterium]